MAAATRHDWQAIIKAIKAGWRARHQRVLTSYKLGEICGLDHSSIEHLETHPGAQPKHYPGEVLLILHAEYEPWARAEIEKKIARKSGKNPIVRCDMVTSAS